VLAHRHTFGTWRLFFELMLSMRVNAKLRRFAAQWPISVVALGIALTLIWIALIAWVPLRILLLT